MCGIAGFVLNQTMPRAARDTPQERLERMLRPLHLRGPDDWGMALWGGPETKADSGRIIWNRDERTAVALGHRRLAILDLSPGGHQPMRSANGTATIVFNGEIYNYIELRAELAGRFAFCSTSDTEVLLAAYQTWGEQMLNRLDGMFAFAIWDETRQRLFCARDPLGIKPFYYATRDGEFIFGSEPRAVLAGLDVRGTVDRQRLAEFLLIGISDHDEGTSFREVRQLRGGHWLEVTAVGLPGTPVEYWTPAGRPERDCGEVSREVCDRIDLAVRRQLRSDVPVGGCLSGGLDSGAIASSVRRALGAASEQFTALTLVSEGFDLNEYEDAKATSEKTRLRWVPVKAGAADFAETLRHTIIAAGEPFTSLSVLGQNLIMREAGTRGLKVMLDGQGGDEVFVGYQRMLQRVMMDYLREGRVGAAWREFNGLMTNASFSPFQAIAGAAYFRLPALVRLRNRRRLDRFVNRELLEAARPETFEAFFGAGTTTAMQVAEMRRFVLPRLLRYEDRNSMQYSVESRVPLLAVNVVDYGLNLPAEWKVRNGWSKFALRSAMADRLPEQIVWGRRKRGFDVPSARWLESLAPAITEWLRDLPAGLPVSSQALIDGMKGPAANEAWFWRALSFALWVRFSEVEMS